MAIDSKRKSFIVSTLRRSSYRWYGRYEAMKRARIERGLYRCNVCKGAFKNKEINLDHILPVVPLTGFDTWEGYLDRLFCEPEGMQVLCKTCHDIKCSLEREERKKNKASDMEVDEPKLKRKKYVRKTKKSTTPK